MSIAEQLDKAIKDIAVKFDGGLSNTSTKKFDDVVKVIAELTSLPEDDIYVTSVYARASNTWNRLSQGKPLNKHFVLGVCIASPDGVQGVLAPLGSFIGDGFVHYDSVAVVAENAEGTWSVQAVATNAKFDTALSFRKEYPQSEIRLLNVVNAPNVDVLHLGLFSTLRRKFVEWYGGRTDKNFAEKSADYLHAICEPVDDSRAVNGKWSGLVEYLTGSSPAKDIFSIESVGDFESAYGRVIPFFCSDEKDAEGFDAERFEDCYAFTHAAEDDQSVNDKDGQITMKAFRGYRKMLDELEAEFGKYMDGSKQEAGSAFQRITYGAPGTGKSWKIDDMVRSCPKNVIRTTFHPDSDYATFVGAYKPTVMTLPRVALVGAELQKVKFEKNAFTDEEKAALEFEKKIVYEFVPQAFTKAYVRAWEKLAEKPDDGEAEKIYLVIEEINRGNCAQVFGDIFQLLDRPNGYSQYPIIADDDLSSWLKSKKGFGENGLQMMKPVDCPLADEEWLDVTKGAKLALPPNLYIWATMNTSDQSLFPMDSAFKRRWDWKYVPIVEGRDKDTKKPLGWMIEVKADGEGQTRSWWDFIRRINIIIEGVTQSEDKKLGYFFAKPKDGGTVIDENTFVSKVVFYVWSEVLKDCPEDDENVADLQLDFEGGKRLPKFVDFFDVENNGEINSKRVKQFLDAVEKVQLPQKQEKQEVETAPAEAN